MKFLSVSEKLSFKGSIGTTYLNCEKLSETRLLKKYQSLIKQGILGRTFFLFVED